MKYIKTFEKLLKNESAILISAKNGSVSGVEKALKNGNNINTREHRGRTPLMEAILNKYISVVDYLIKHGADVNLQDYDGRTALMMTSTSKILNILLNADADVNIISYNGNNAIMEYLNYQVDSDKFIKSIDLFLEKGLNLDHTNSKDENLYDMIKTNQKIHTGDTYKLKYYFEVEDYMNSKFPKYKEDWEINQNMKKYNL